MKTLSFNVNVPTISDAKALVAKAKIHNEARKAKREAKRMINAERDQRLTDLAAELLKARSQS